MYILVCWTIHFDYAPIMMIELFETFIIPMSFLTGPKAYWEPRAGNGNAIKYLTPMFIDGSENLFLLAFFLRSLLSGVDIELCLNNPCRE